MKRVWLMVGIILIIGGVVFEEKHRAETVKQRSVPLVSTDPALIENDYVIKASNFSDQVDLWGDPWKKITDPDLTYASLVFQNELRPASMEKFQLRPNPETEPVLTVLDRQVAYSFLELGSFKFQLNFKPAYPNPEAVLPTRIDPSISGSFSF